MKKVPIGFFFFNRPAETALVWERIKQYRPTDLFLVSDGPRPDREGERRVVEDLRRTIVGSIDWDCRVIEDFAQSNLGCATRVSSGLQSLFRRFDFAIVLEDDCLPAPTFFEYVENAFCRFDGDRTVGAVTGTNLHARLTKDLGYFQSFFPQIWGWAGWARAFEGYSLDLSGVEAALVISRLRERRCEPLHAWEKHFDWVKRNPLYTWDYQFIYNFLSRGMTCITPGKNLISNIGYGPNATHTTSSYPRFGNLPWGSPKSLDDGASEGFRIQVGERYDRFLSKNYYLGLRTFSSVRHSMRGRMVELLRIARIRRFGTVK
jgi:hypothetical protein